MTQKITADQIKALRGLPARQFKRAVLEILDRARKSETPGSGPGASGECDGEDRTSPVGDPDQHTHPRQAGQVSAAGREVNPGGLASPWSPSRVRAREARASLSLSDDSKKLEREDDSLPRAWAEAAEREREHLSLPPVRLDVAWRKAVHWYAEHGRELTIGGWLRWAIRERLDHENAPIRTHAASAAPKTGQPPAPLVAAGEAVREEIRQRAELRWFFEGGRWSERQGPRPGEEGCRYPAAIIAETRQKYRRDYFIG